MTAALPTLSEIASELVLLDAQDPAGIAALAEHMSALVGTLGAGEDDLAAAIACLRGATAGDASAVAAAISRAGAHVERCQEPPEYGAVCELLPVDDPIRREFIGRGRELATALGSDVARHIAGDPSALAELRRDLHSLKGEAGALDFRALAHACHDLEERLADAGALPAADLRAATDRIAELLERLADHGMRGAEPDRGADGAPAAGARGGEPHAAARAQAVRVDAARLDVLAEAVGELVTATGMLVDNPELTALRSRRVRELLKHLDRSTRSIQEMTLRLRLVSFRDLLQRSARIARETAQQLGRELEVALVGEDQELDRVLADRLAEPLLHLVRNAVDHGVEPAAERVAAGKPPFGTLTITVGRRSEGLVIEVSDDGRGLERARILDRARAQGVAGSAGELEDAEVWKLLFAPGFSTAAAVTAVSGRGVGLDVVRATIEGLHGRIAMAPRPGGGTTVTMRLPLTLAIIDGMVVIAGEREYIVPTLSVVSTLRLPAASAAVRARPVSLIDYQGTHLPLVDLGLHFGTAGVSQARSLAMIVDDGTRRAAIAIDGVLGRRQVVIKDLGRGLPPVGGIGGAAIAEDGRVRLVCDVASLLDSAFRNPTLRAAS